MSKLLLCFLLLVSHLLASATHANFTMHFQAIYQFGDSLSDTGNFVRAGPSGAATAYARLPYGQTFFHRPTGRCSDGLLMVDYFATHLGLPLLKPYLAKGSDFSHGANFAVVGATALDPVALAAKNVSTRVGSSSLDTQLAWFRSHLNSICSNPTECKEKLEKALILMGEIGGNDYNFAFFQGRTMKQAFELIPQVVQTIKDAVHEVIKVGAVNVVVPGNFPIGCVPLYLVRFGTSKRWMYDDLQCLKGFNMFSKAHNNQLQKAIWELQQDHPGVAIVYADYYAALRWLIRHASSLGFERGGSRKTCCAIGHNPYNYDLKRSCGSPGVPVCPDPTKRVSWDGIHMTQQANKYVAKWLLTHFVPQLHQPSFLA